MIVQHIVICGSDLSTSCKIHNESQFDELSCSCFIPTSFDIVADENVENFYNYFVTKFNDNGTTIASIINGMMKNYNDMEWSTFETISV